MKRGGFSNGFIRHSKGRNRRWQSRNEKTKAKFSPASPIDTSVQMRTPAMLKVRLRAWMSIKPSYTAPYWCPCEAGTQPYLRLLRRDINQQELASSDR